MQWLLNYSLKLLVSCSKQFEKPWLPLKIHRSFFCEIAFSTSSVIAVILWSSCCRRFLYIRHFGFWFLIIYEGTVLGKYVRVSQVACKGEIRESFIWDKSVFVPSSFSYFSPVRCVLVSGYCAVRCIDVCCIQCYNVFATKRYRSVFGLKTLIYDFCVS